MYYNAMEEFADFCEDLTIAQESSQTILKTYHEASEEMVQLTYSLNRDTSFKEQKAILKRMVNIADRCIVNIRKDKLSENETEEIVKLKAVDEIADSMYSAIRHSLNYTEVSSYTMDSIKDTIRKGKRQIMQLYASENVDINTLQVSKKALIENLQELISVYNKWIDAIDSYYSKKNALDSGNYRKSIFGDKHARKRAAKSVARARRDLYENIDEFSSGLRDDLVDDEDSELY